MTRGARSVAVRTPNACVVVAQGTASRAVAHPHARGRLDASQRQLTSASCAPPSIAASAAAALASGFGWCEGESPSRGDVTALVLAHLIHVRRGGARGVVCAASVVPHRDVGAVRRA
jgi:hypothetical protein